MRTATNPADTPCVCQVASRRGWIQQSPEVLSMQWLLKELNNGFRVVYKCLQCLQSSENWPSKSVCGSLSPSETRLDLPWDESGSSSRPSHLRFFGDDMMMSWQLGNPPCGQARNRADNEMLTALNHYTMEPGVKRWLKRVPCSVWLWVDKKTVRTGGIPWSTYYILWKAM